MSLCCVAAISATIEVGWVRVHYPCVCAVLSCFSRIWLFVTLWTVAHQAPLSMGFFRQEDWSGLPGPPPGDLPKPGIEPESPMSPTLVGGFFTTSAAWEACITPITRLKLNTVVQTIQSNCCFIKRSFKAMNFRRKAWACHCSYSIKPRRGRLLYLVWVPRNAKERDAEAPVRLQSRSSLEGRSQPVSWAVSSVTVFPPAVWSQCHAFSSQ